MRDATRKAAECLHLPRLLQVNFEAFAIAPGLGLGHLALDGQNQVVQPPRDQEIVGPRLDGGDRGLLARNVGNDDERQVAAVVWSTLSASGALNLACCSSPARRPSLHD